ncbi:MAG: hypothetical protein ACK4M7_10495, partial [Burkholderiales bacterium]
LNAVYVIVSHGANGLGAFQANGVQRATTNISSEEIGNVMGTEYSKYVASAQFDDIVWFSTKSFLDALVSYPSARIITKEMCDNNRVNFAAINQTVALAFRNNLTDIQVAMYPSDAYNKGDHILTELMWTMQSICADSTLYYATAKTCPAGATYNATTDTCSCPSGNWQLGGC